MLNFKPITLQDKQEIQTYTAKHNYHLCEHCFVDLFIWATHYETQFCTQDGFLFIKMLTFPDRLPMYLAPVGEGDLRHAVQLLEQDAAERGNPFVMTSIPEEMLPEIQKVMPDELVIENLPNGADYIYLAEKMITLSGKKLQSKRNFINRFKQTYEGRWQYEKIDAHNVEDAYQFHLEWCEDNGCADNGSFRGETCAIRRALDNFDSLELQGGILRVDGKVIAFTLGSRSTDDMYIIQIEKANANIPGAYPMINQQFAMHNCTEVMYINREEDLGLEGLRKAKRSYHPIMMGNKYMAMRNV